MEFGFYVPTKPPLNTSDSMKALVSKGEELGYGYLAVGDHIVVPKSVESTYPYSDGGDWPAGRSGEVLEPLSMLAYLAGQTSTARLLTSVIVVPHRPPVITAKMLSTIDTLSGGRLTVGCGAGWCEEEFESVGAPPYAERGKVTDEYIRVFKELWTREDPEFHGEYADFSNITFLPRSLQNPHPPIWIGGESKTAMRRVVRVGDGWFPFGHNPRFPLDTLDRYKAGLDTLRGLAEENGRDFRELQQAYVLMRWGSAPGDALPPMESDGPATDANRRLMSGSIEQMAHDIKALESLGVTALILVFERPTLSESLDCMEAFARDVIPLTK